MLSLFVAFRARGLGAFNIIIMITEAQIFLFVIAYRKYSKISRSHQEVRVGVGLWPDPNNTALANEA
jgi:tetrahydromethanopterin S-methyltransferase subunit C